MGEIANAGSVASLTRRFISINKERVSIRLTIKKKPVRIIEDDSEWGNIIDLNVYNGNIYLLDSEKDEVYKYLVAEKGYSEKILISNPETLFS